jgi:hypothetical protein
MKPILPLPPFLAACRQRARPGDRVGQIDLIGIPTANRVPTFARAARSYLANARDFGRKPELTVADDSADPTVGAEYRRLLASLAREFDVPVSYAGPAEKQAYAGLLAREADVAPALVEFALGNPFHIGYRPGANRNALLLHSAGRAVFNADDDTICRPAPGTAKPWSLRLTDLPDPTTVRPYESLEQLEQDVAFTPTDVLGEHARVLGSDIGSLLPDKPDVSVAIRQPGVMQAVHENRLRVAVSWNGIAGDCGHRLPLFLLHLPEPAMRHFTRDESAYRRMLASRQIHRACDRLTITPGGYCQSTALALDNRRPLPPFLPVLRGEDVVFGHLLPHFQPSAAIAFQTTSLLHVPAHRRTETEPLADGIARHRSQSSLLLTLLHLAGSRTTGQPPRFEELAGRARQILEGEYFELLAANAQRQESEQLIRTGLAQLLARPDAPDYWRRDVESVNRALHATAPGGTYLYPAELSDSCAPAERAGILRNILASYFALLAAWPALWAAAKTLRDRDGITPAQPVAGL